MEVDARMNRQHPSSSLPGSSHMSMNNCAGVGTNFTTRNIPKDTTRQRRTGLATVMEEYKLHGIGSENGLGDFFLFPFFYILLDITNGGFGY